MSKQVENYIESDMEGGLMQGLILGLYMYKHDQVEPVHSKVCFAQSRTHP